MKIEVELKPFNVPNFVLAKRNAMAVGEEASFSLSQVSAETLAELCDTFRREVFRKAGKRDPEWDMPRASP